jgi:hypothetical protein
MSSNDLEVKLDAQIDTDGDDPGDAGMLKIAYRPMAFFEERCLAQRSHVQGRNGVDVTSVGLTRIVDQAGAHFHRYLANSRFGTSHCPKSYG